MRLPWRLHRSVLEVPVQGALVGSVVGRWLEQWMFPWVSLVWVPGVPAGTGRPSLQVGLAGKGVGKVQLGAVGEARVPVLPRLQRQSLKDCSINIFVDA